MAEEKKQRTIKFRTWDKVLNKWRIVEMREENTYLQFTGLYDKHNKEIYEGDIIKVDGEVMVVEWYCGGFVLGYCDGGWVDPINEFFPNEKCGTDLEVIGNIWEHPELLERKQ